MTFNTLTPMSAFNLSFSATTALNATTFTTNQTTQHMHDFLTSATTHLNATLVTTTALSIILLLLVTALSFSYRTLSRLPFFPQYVQSITIFHALATEAVQLVLALTAIVTITSILDSGIPSLRSPECKIREAWALEAAACLVVVVFWCAIVDAVDRVEGRILLGRWGHPYGGNCLVVTQCTFFELEESWRGRPQVRRSGSRVRERRQRNRPDARRGRETGTQTVDASPTVAEPANNDPSEVDRSSAEATSGSRTPSSVSLATPPKGVLIPTPPESTKMATRTTSHSGNTIPATEDLEANAGNAAPPSPPDSVDTTTSTPRIITKEQHRHFRVIDTVFYCKDIDAGSPTKSGFPRSQSAPPKLRRYVYNKPRALSDASGVLLAHTLWEHGRDGYLVPLSPVFAVAALTAETSEETTFQPPTPPFEPALEVQSTPKSYKQVVCHRLATAIPPGVGYF